MSGLIQILAPQSKPDPGCVPGFAILDSYNLPIDVGSGLKPLDVPG